MRIMYWLRKLGILRWGATSGTYTNAAERPTELMMDGVFNAEKDLVGGDKKTSSVRENERARKP